MIKTARAVAFAAVAFCATIAFTDATPLRAENGEAQAAAHFLDHAAAAVELPEIGLNGEPAAAGATPAAVNVAAEAPAANRFASLHASAPAVLTSNPFASLRSSAAPTAPLASLVAAQARFETEDREQDCLANAVYFEARGESLEGQLAVAEVVLNRARSGRYPTTICAVVVQPAQVSFVRRGVIPAADRGCEAWRRAVAIARIAQAGERRLLAHNVLWYHANYVSPSWGRRLERNTQIGLHIFYS